MAIRKLRAFGREARPAFEKAAKDSDPEVAARARWLLRRLELVETLPRRLLKAIPAIEDRLAADEGPSWTRAFLDAVAVEDGREKYPDLGRRELEPLVARAAAGSREPTWPSPPGPATPTPRCGPRPSKRFGRSAPARPSPASWRSSAPPTWTSASTPSSASPRCGHGKPSRNSAPFSPGRLETCGWPPPRPSAPSGPRRRSAR